MAQQSVTVTGNLTEDPELRGPTTNGGHVCNVRIASSRAVRDPEGSNGWRTYDQLFITGEIWGDLAVNVRKSLRRGMPVLATGTLITHEWEVEDNGVKAKRQKVVLKIYQMGLDLNRYIIGSRRTDIQDHNSEGLSLPDGDTSDYIDRALATRPDDAEVDPASLQPA